MITEMREKLGREIEALTHELTVMLPQAIAQAVEMGDLRENSEYKAALERQQFVQARLGQLHHRLNQLTQLANTETPTDRVLAEMMDLEDGHVSFASPLGRALVDRRVGDEVELRLPRMIRRLRVTELVTIHQA